MSAALLAPLPVPVRLPAGPSAAETWDAICRGMGIVPLSPAQAADLPPWTEQEADTFERTITDAFERIEEASPRRP